jgi:tRNA threonylcarbamoyladenosine biosynthesis protein TsaE
MEYISKSYADTVHFGNRIGKTLRGGEVLILTGELGSGKTALTKGIAAACGIDDVVTSPSFAIMNEYSGNPNLYHFDFYRIDDSLEMEQLLEDFVYGKNGVTVIEWGERAAEFLESFIMVHIAIEAALRRFTIERKNC